MLLGFIQHIQDARTARFMSRNFVSDNHISVEGTAVPDGVKHGAHLLHPEIQCSFRATELHPRLEHLALVGLSPNLDEPYRLLLRVRSR